jgi:hypothetical protein
VPACKIIKIHTGQTTLKVRHFLDAKREFTQKLINFVDTGRILSSDEKKKRLLANQGHRIQPRRKDVESAAKAAEPAGTRIWAKETRSGTKIPLRQPSLMRMPLRQPSLIVRLKRKGAESDTSKRRTSGVVRARRGRNRKCRAVARQRAGGMHALRRGYRYSTQWLDPQNLPLNQHADRRQTKSPSEVRGEKIRPRVIEPRWRAIRAVGRKSDAVSIERLEGVNKLKE